MKDIFDWKIIELLQDNARISYAELGRLVGLSSSAIAERVQKLEELGIIQGYTLKLNPKKMGYGLSAIITMPLRKNLKYFISILNKFPEIIDCYRVTGQDCITIKAVLSDSEHLEGLIDRLGELGSPSTSIVLSTILTNGKIQNINTI